MASSYKLHGFLDACAQHRPWNSLVRANAGTKQQCRCFKGCEAAQLAEQQPDYKSAGRRAALIAVGISPFLVGVQAVRADSSSIAETAGSAAGQAVSNAAARADSTQAPSVSEQQQEQAAPPDGSQQGSSLSDSVDQADRDDSAVDSLEDDGSSGSDSDSSSDSDSESSSDEEPGELFASSDDNNAAGGSSTSTSTSSSGGGSDGSSGTIDSNKASSSGQGASSPSNDPSSSTSSSSGGGSGSNASSSRPVSRTTMGSNLSVPSYIQILQESRLSSWPLLAQKIQAREWIEFSQLLVQPPFDAVRQACFYIPWALLQSDDFTAAVAARKAYVDYIDHVHALAAIALKAADGVPGADVQVQQSFTLMNASLNAFLSAVPVKYQRYRV